MHISSLVGCQSRRSDIDIVNRDLTVFDIRKVHAEGLHLCEGLHSCSGQRNVQNEVSSCGIRDVVGLCIALPFAGGAGGIGSKEGNPRLRT